jgi:nucleotide-binding universal stress UspA family protein
MFERILVTLDGSELAEHALPYAVELANACASEIFLVKVCQGEEINFSAACQAYLERRAEQLKGKVTEKVRIKTAVLSGRPAHEIAKCAAEINANLIVITSHGRSGIGSWLLGSTANEIIHSVRVPVLVIKLTESSPTFVKIKRFLVPLDGSERGEAILPYVEELAQKLSSEVILIRIVVQGKHVHTVGGLDFVYFKDKDLQRMKLEAQEYLNRVCARLKLQVIRPEVRIGEPHLEIIKYAEQHDCNLIAMSSHGHSCVEQWTYGSVTYKILHESTRPVLLLPLKMDFPKPQ